MNPKLLLEYVDKLSPEGLKVFTLLISQLGAIVELVKDSKEYYAEGSGIMTEDEVMFTKQGFFYAIYHLDDILQEAKKIEDLDPRALDLLKESCFVLETELKQLHSINV